MKRNRQRAQKERERKKKDENEIKFIQGLKTKDYEREPWGAVVIFLLEVEMSIKNKTIGDVM